jgi:hypothetical protein
MTKLIALTITAAALAFTGVASAAKPHLVWCVAPGEKVTQKLKREYPELRIPRKVCAAING